MQETVDVRPSRMILRFSSHAERVAEDIRYWNERSVEEMMRATAELSSLLFGREGLISMLKDQIALLSAFNAHGVEYIVIGGYAVNLYAQTRFTKDLDILIRNSEANSQAVCRALAPFPVPAGLSPEYFVGKPEQFFQVGVEPDRIDILQGIPGVSFDEAYRDATIGSVDGVSVRFISREHLITNKLAAGRPCDIGDVDELRRFTRKP
jgi:predicted nucleotidyltransferase